MWKIKTDLFSLTQIHAEIHFGTSMSKNNKKSASAKESCFSRKVHPLPPKKEKKKKRRTIFQQVSLAQKFCLYFLTDFFCFIHVCQCPLSSRVFRKVGAILLSTFQSMLSPELLHHEKICLQLMTIICNQLAGFVKSFVRKTFKFFCCPNCSPSWLFLLGGGNLFFSDVK